VEPVRVKKRVKTKAAALLQRADRSTDYFSDVLIDVNLVLSVGPMAWTLAMIANAMPQAIRQYSIAVAPD
jgi:hypothetical protein